MHCQISSYLHKGSFFDHNTMDRWVWQLHDAAENNFRLNISSASENEISFSLSFPSPEIPEIFIESLSSCAIFYYEFHQSHTHDRFLVLLR